MRVRFLLLPLMLACSTANDGGTAVGADGGTVTTEGAAVEIPTGALSGDVTVTVTPVTEGLPDLPEGFTASGTAYAFTPHGTTFDVPVTITLPYTGDADTVLRLDDEADTTWEIVPATFAGGVASVETSTFSIYVTTSACASLCTYAESECTKGGGTVPGTAHGTCTSDCATTALRPSQAKGCTTEVSALLACYLGTTGASAFTCGGDLLPTSSTCAAESAAVAACAAGSSGSGCPCFVAADLTSAATDANTYVSGAFAFSQECTVSKGFPTGSFGDPTTVNTVVLQTRDDTSEQYFAWFSAGTMTIDAGTGPEQMCMVWAGDSNPSHSFLGVPTDGSPPAAPLFSHPLSDADLAACITELQSYRTSAGLATCVEQH